MIKINKTIYHVEETKKLSRTESKRIGDFHEKD